MAFAYAHESLAFVVGPHQAVHHQAIVLLKEFPEKEAPGKAGRAGKQDLPEPIGRHGIGSRFVRLGRMYESA